MFDFAIHRVRLSDWDGRNAVELTGWSSIEVVGGISQTRSAKVRVPLSVPGARELHGRLSPRGRKRRLVSVYRLDPYASVFHAGATRPELVYRRIFCGRKTSAVLARDGKRWAVEVNALDPSEEFGFRVVDDVNRAGRTPAGFKFPAGSDKSFLAYERILASNELYGFMHVRGGDVVAGGSLDAGGFPTMHTLSEMLNDLGALAGGFEWQVVPDNRPEDSDDDREVYFDQDGPIWGRISIKPRIGGDRTRSVIFSDGGPASNATLTLGEDDTALSTITSHVAGESPTVVVTNDPDSAALAEVGYRETVLEESGVIAETIRKPLVNDHAALTGTPRDISDITPGRSDMTGIPAIPGDPHSRNWNCPVPFISYGPGDTVLERAYDDDEAATPIFEARSRVYQLSLSVNEKGEETATISTQHGG